MPFRKDVHLFTRTFKRPFSELRYQREILADRLKLFRLLILIIALISPVFLLTDHEIARQESFRYLVLDRLFIIFYLLFVFVKTRRLTNFRAFHFWLIITVAVFFAHLIITITTYRADNYLFALYDVMIIIAFFGSGLLPLITEIVLAGLYSVGVALLIILIKEFESYDSFVILMAYATANVVGFIISYQRHGNSRKAYALRRQLSQKSLALSRLSFRDTLTNAYNRRAFHNHFEGFQRSALRAQRDGNGVFLVVGDLDHFKSINDGYGHDIGDLVLVRFTNLIKRSTRSTDTLYRFGGEEFVFVFQSTQKSHVIERVNALMDHLNQLGLGIDVLQKKVTCSFGITQLTPDDCMDSVVNRADKALYAAKDAGRNQLVFIDAS